MFEAIDKDLAELRDKAARRFGDTYEYIAKCERRGAVDGCRTEYVLHALWKSPDGWQCIGGVGATHEATLDSLDNDVQKATVNTRELSEFREWKAQQQQNTAAA